MANKKNLKRDLNYVIGEIIEAVYVYQIANPKEDVQKSEAIIDEAIAAFDAFIVKINDREVENRGKHLKQVNTEIEVKAKELVEKLNAL